VVVVVVVAVVTCVVLVVNTCVVAVSPVCLVLALLALLWAHLCLLGGFWLPPFLVRVCGAWDVESYGVVRRTRRRRRRHHPHGQKETRTRHP